MACTLLVWAACGAATLPLPSKGGPSWRELTSEHFTKMGECMAKAGLSEASGKVLMDIATEAEKL